MLTSFPLWLQNDSKSFHNWLMQLVKARHWCRLKCRWISCCAEEWIWYAAQSTNTLSETIFHCLLSGRILHLFLLHCSFSFPQRIIVSFVLISAAVLWLIFWHENKQQQPRMNLPRGPCLKRCMYPPPLPFLWANRNVPNIWPLVFPAGCGVSANDGVEVRRG